MLFSGIRLKSVKEIVHFSLNLAKFVDILEHNNSEITCQIKEHDTSNAKVMGLILKECKTPLYLECNSSHFVQKLLENA